MTKIIALIKTVYDAATYDGMDLTYFVDVPDFWTIIAPHLDHSSYEAVRLTSSAAHRAPIVDEIYARILEKETHLKELPFPNREAVRRLTQRNLCFRCGGSEYHGPTPAMLMLCHCVTLRGKPPFFVRMHAACVRGAEEALWRDRAVYGGGRSVTVVRCPFCAVDRVALLLAQTR